MSPESADIQNLYTYQTVSCIIDGREGIAGVADLNEPANGNIPQALFKDLRTKLPKDANLLIFAAFTPDVEGMMQGANEINKFRGEYDPEMEIAVVAKGNNPKAIELLARGVNSSAFGFFRVKVYSSMEDAKAAYGIVD